VLREDNEIITFPGRNVAEAIGEILRAVGYDVGAPEYMDEHGWDLNVRVDGRRIWLELQGINPGEFVLQVEAMVGFFRRLSPMRVVDFAYYAEFLTRLNEGLKNDPRFSKVEWYELRNHTPVGEAVHDPLKAMNWPG
jgi:hypothetical protein